MEMGAERRAAGSAAGLPVAWRVNGERVVVLGWGAAVLLQFAHPLVAQGVADHSSFRTSPRQRLARFRHTLGAMLTLTYGSLKEATRVARAIDAIHGRVNGYLRMGVGAFPAGTPYSARDPELLTWVHATLLDVNLRTYEAFVGPLSREEKDRYCAEVRWIGPLLGVAAERLPGDTAQLAAYLDGMLAGPRIAVGPTARQLARDLLEGDAGLAGLLDLPVRAPYGLVTAGLLPPALRAAYGFRWTPLHASLFRASAGAARRARALLPRAARCWPEAHRAINSGRVPAFSVPI